MKVYFDTNILRDYLENRNSKSTQLLEEARQKKWECVTSVFTMMELADLQQDTVFFQKTVINRKWDVDRFLRERRQKELHDTDFKDLDEYLSNVTVKLPFLVFFNLPEEGWNIAQYMKIYSVLSAVDIVHLATAYTAGSDIVVTNDRGFIKSGNEILKRGKRKVRVCLPEKVGDTAKELGLKM